MLVGAQITCLVSIHVKVRVRVCREKDFDVRRLKAIPSGRFLPPRRGKWFYCTEICAFLHNNSIKSDFECGMFAQLAKLCSNICWYLLDVVLSSKSFLQISNTCIWECKFIDKICQNCDYKNFVFSEIHISVTWRLSYELLTAS